MTWPNARQYMLKKRLLVCDHVERPDVNPLAWLRTPAWQQYWFDSCKGDMCKHLTRHWKQSYPSTIATLRLGSFSFIHINALYKFTITYLLTLSWRPWMSYTCFQQRLLEITVRLMTKSFAIRSWLNWCSARVAVNFTAIRIVTVVSYQRRWQAQRLTVMFDTMSTYGTCAAE